MKIRIRDWEKHFEQDRSKQWKHLKWVPIPNKQGAGYRKIMSEKKGLEIFACWIALVQTASMCDPRGDLSKYDLSDLSRLTIIESKILEKAILYLSQVLDWIENIENLDKNVNNLDISVCQSAVGSSILFNSVLSNSVELRSTSFKELINKYNQYPQIMLDEFYKYWSEPNRSNKKMLFELKPTWELSRRLATWASRDKNLINQKPPKKPYDQVRAEADERERLAAADKLARGEGPHIQRDGKGMQRIKDILNG